MDVSEDAAAHEAVVVFEPRSRLWRKGREWHDGQFPSAVAFNRHHGSVMKINRSHIRVAAFSSAIAMLLQIAPVMADPKLDRNRPIEVTFTKWVTEPVFVPDNFGITEGRGLMAGFTGGDIPGTFVGEVLQGQRSANPALRTSINRLEAIYEVHDLNGGHVFTALIRGGTNRATGAALLNGVVLAGWRTGAPVHVEFVTIVGCVGAPTPTTTCFEGTIHVGRAPKRDN
jgi:hypothetical protein